MFVWKDENTGKEPQAGSFFYKMSLVLKFKASHWHFLYSILIVVNCTKNHEYNWEKALLKNKSYFAEYLKLEYICLMPPSSTIATQFFNFKT